MKLFPIAAVVGALALASAAFAQAPPPGNKADCTKAKMKWDPKGGADKKGACVAPKTDSKKK